MLQSSSTLQTEERVGMLEINLLGKHVYIRDREF